MQRICERDDVEVIALFEKNDERGKEVLKSLGLSEDLLVDDGGRTDILTVKVCRCHILFLVLLIEVQPFKQALLAEEGRDLVVRSVFPDMIPFDQTILVAVATCEQVTIVEFELVPYGHSSSILVQNGGVARTTYIVPHGVSDGRDAVTWRER